MFGRRLGSETDTPTGEALINNLELMSGDTAIILHTSSWHRAAPRKNTALVQSFVNVLLKGTNNV